MKNSEIVAFFNAKNSLKGKRLPMQLAFALKLNYEKLKPHADAYNEQFAEIRKKYEGADGIIEPGENRENFVKEVNELLDISVPLDGIQKVGAGVIGKCDQEKFDSLTLEELETLGFMVVQTDAAQ